jgi:hypothetical protein
MYLYTYINSHLYQFIYKQDPSFIPGGGVAGDAAVARAFNILKSATAKW